MSKRPVVSVVIVNYNGQHFLLDCLSSVEKQTFSRDQYEIIVVDNNSTDSSKAILKKYFPDVILVESDKNLGFAAGNNLGIAHAQGEYIVLLNTDTIVLKNWLEPLLRKIQSSPKIASVNSKSLLATPFIKIEVKVNSTQQNCSSHVFEIKTNEDNAELLLSRIRALNTTSTTKQAKSTLQVSTNQNHLSLLLPCFTDSTSTYMLDLISSSQTDLPSFTVQVANEKKKQTLQSKKCQPIEIILDVNQNQSNLIWQVQNAGNLIFKSGHSRDRGAVAGINQHYYETDNHYFDQSCQVNALCGVSVILRKDAFEKVGGFDESLFMYYEDIDLSLKLRKAGYELWYEPSSVLYHHHAGSSKEWSDFFTYHVEKNHLAVVAKHFPFATRLRQFAEYKLLLLVSAARLVKAAFTIDGVATKLWFQRTILRLSVLLYTFSRTLSYFKYRTASEAKSVLTPQQLQQTHY